MFLILQVFLKDKPIAKIETYDDFKDSDCELLILIHDVEYVEIYIKDNLLSEKVLLNIKQMGIKYDVKTLENDTRTIMIV